MSGWIGTLRTGSWLTLERVRLWAAASLIASAAGLIYILATAHGISDYQGRPIGTDFSNVYAAGTYVLEGRPEAPFDGPTQHARAREIFGPDTPVYGWHYPPFFLFIAAALALFPYLPALALWQGTTLAAYLWSIREIVATSLPSTETDARKIFPLFFAIAFPAVFVNLGHGHNGFLTAALMGFALLWLDARPILSGILIGLLAYKPQFGLLIPFALIAGGRWRTFTAASITVALLVISVTLAFGPKVWLAFIESSRFTREVVLEAGGPGWHKIQSAFAWARMWGAPVSVAYAIQILVTLMLVPAVIWLWRSPTSAQMKAAGLILAALLGTPYSLDYDLMVLAPAIAFWACDGFSRGFRDWEKTMLAALWILPLVARTVAEATSIPLTVPLLLTAFTLLLRNAAHESDTRLFWIFPRRA